MSRRSGCWRSSSKRSSARLVPIKTVILATLTLSAHTEGTYRTRVDCLNRGMYDCPISTISYFQKLRRNSFRWYVLSLRFGMGHKFSLFFGKDHGICQKQAENRILISELTLLNQLN